MRKNILSLAAVVASLLSTLVAPFSAQAQDYMPYPEADITLDQWESYHSAVKACCEASQQLHQERGLVTYQKGEDGLTFTFTLRNHPAHPAWITQRAIVVEDKAQMQLTGYFAGSEPEFAKLFESFYELTQKLHELMQSQVKEQAAQPN